MKFKTILVIALVILTVFVIYLTTMDRNIYYLDLNMGNYNYEETIVNFLKDEKKLERYVTGYIEKDYRTTDLINDIKNNKSINIKNKKQTIKNALIKADLLIYVPSINDINYKLNTTNQKELYNYADEMLEDMEEAIKLMRQYCKEDIIVIGLENSNKKIFNYINEKLGEICYENKIYFINPLKLNKNGKKYVEKEIKKIIENNYIENIDE